MNKVFLEGNLTRDPEIKSVSLSDGVTKVKVANFTVATTRYFKKSDSSRGSETTFILCEAWATGAESIEKLLKKGDPILLEGTLKVESWEKDGEKHSRTKVRVDTFKKLYRREKTEEEKAAASTSQDEPVGAGVGADAPF